MALLLPPRFRAPLGQLVFVAVTLVASAEPALAAPGDLDPSFSGDGWNRSLQIDGKTTDTWYPVADVAVQNDGGVLVAGTVDLPYDPSGWGFAVARYLPNGEFDTSFGPGKGGVVAYLEGTEFAEGAALQPDGKLVVTGEGGCEQSSANRCFATARFTADGLLDPTFGENGWVTTDFSGPRDGAYDVVVQPDGRIVVVGYQSDYGDSNDHEQFGVARYLPDGQLDPTFSKGGTRIVNFRFGNAVAEVVALQPDGNILIGGRANGDVLGGGSDFALVRLRQDGTLDRTFSGDGKLTTNFGGYRTDRILGLWLQSDGHVVAAGSTAQDVSNVDLKIALVRYRPDGKADSGFGNRGRQTTGVGPHGAWGEDVLGIGDKILVGGGSYIDEGQSEADFTLVRYTVDGSLDQTFSADGKATYNLLSGWNWVKALVPYGSDRVVGAGPIGGAFGVARWLM